MESKCADQLHIRFWDFLTQTCVFSLRPRLVVHLLSLVVLVIGSLPLWVCKQWKRSMLIGFFFSFFLVQMIHKLIDPEAIFICVFMSLQVLPPCVLYSKICAPCFLAQRAIKLFVYSTDWFKWIFMSKKSSFFPLMFDCAQILLKINKEDIGLISHQLSIQWSRSRVRELWCSQKDWNRLRPMWRQLIKQYLNLSKAVSH